MKRLLPFILILSILLSGCGALNPAAPAADATATISAEDIRATADAMVYGMLTQTAAAMPTNTPIPPTETPLPEPTATMIPTLVQEVPVVEPTAEIIAMPTSSTTTTYSSATYPCTEKPLTGWTGESVDLKTTNNVKDSTASIYLCITTPYGEAGYMTVSAGNTVQIPYGTVFATAWVDGKKDFNASVGFEVKNSATVQLVIEEGNLYFRLGCAPGC